MKLLIKQARIIDPSSPQHGKTTDILIENGVISGIGSLNDKADQLIEGENLLLSPGWVDCFADFGDPGYEFRETLETGAAAAAAGGYTDVIVIPNTSPTIHNKSGVEYIVQKSHSLPVNIHPTGAISRNTEGKELAEMYDMRASGAIAFTDGIHSVQSPGLFLKALLYVKAFNGLLIQLPDDKTISPHGLMNEGIVSTQLGLPGKPAMAEELIVARDIRLAEYAGSRLHLTGISTKTSIDLVRDAKAKGIQLTCSVTPYHLIFSDKDLQQYDSNLKVNPPLRTNTDREALQNAVADGTVDCIATHHLPHEYDSKVLEFEYAKNGMIGLETSYASLNTAMPSIPQEKWVELFSTNPRKIFGLESCTIKKGSAPSLTLFDAGTKWTYTEKTIRSRSRNSPFSGKEFTGKVKGIIHRQKYIPG